MKMCFWIKVVLIASWYQVLFLHLWGQTTGLLVSDERYLNLPLLPTYSGTKFNEIPPKVTLKRYCPVPADQHQSSTCVGWALGYGLLTIQRAALSNQTDQAVITQQAHSAAFIYNQLVSGQAGCSGGAYIESGLQLLKEKGCCLEQSFNFGKYGCSQLPMKEHLEEAESYRVQDFASVFALNEEPKAKISKACKILATRTPIAVGIGVTKSFFDILPGTVLWDPDPNEPIIGYHAMVLVGYNSVEKYFELLNSFGPSWGQNGFIRLPYDDFERLCRYAYVIVLDARTPAFSAVTRSPAPPVVPESEKLHRLSGEFVFRQPAGFVIADGGDELMYFEEIKPFLVEENRGVYRTQQKAFSVGEVFQLVARDVPRGCHIYVFSQSPDGTINIHFPRKGTLHGASASFVLDQTTEIVIPDEEHLLQLPQAGEDYLSILYSYEPISDFEHRLQQIRHAKQDIVSSIYRFFADYLVPSDRIRYAPDQMAFSAVVTPSKGHIAVSLTLIVNAQ